ncbi:MAG: hypothetical protein IT317_01600 [Anaerolineales bacterium]|nr:hypothetical protein [Anaerolineales bacterium]
MRSDHFRNPPNEYRTVPFWGWNDDIQPDEVARQVQAFAEGGFGGFFIHARDGLLTPYLSEVWMDRVRLAAAESRRHGIRCWIYDEHPFPAGHAGGMVPVADERFRNRVLVCKLDNRPLAWPGLVRAYAATESQGDISALQPLDDPAAYHGSANLFFYFFEQVAPLGDVSCRGFSYIDALNPEAVRAFLDYTHAAYQRALGAELGDTVPGFYSDVPVLAWFYSAPKGALPWTPALPGRFLARKGYDLCDCLPSLLFDVGDFHRVRHDFWEVVTGLFVESYSQQVYEWCTQHGTLFTGHFWGEEMLQWQPCWTGAVMPHFEFMHWPGCDHIGRRQDDPLGIKQVDSVVCQLGKARLQTETYAMSGHGLSFEDRKWIGDWEYALGTNFLVHYIPAYSLRGHRKRDEPPSLFIQQPYWPYTRMVEDYYARLSYALSQGQRVTDILLLQPMSTIWSVYRPTGADPGAMRPSPDPFTGANFEAVQYGEWFQELTEGLLASHRDHHYGDETLLARHARVESGKFVVGRMAYRVVIVPPSLTWQPATLALLSDFVEQGGKVLAIRPLPTHIGGVSQAGAVLPAGVAALDNRLDQVLAALDQCLPADIQIDAPGIVGQHRRDGDQDIYFFANTSRTETRQVTARLQGEGTYALWDAHTGAARPVASRAAPSGSEVVLELPPVGSRLLVRVPGPPADVPAPPVRTLAAEVAAAANWSLKRLHPNALMLDYCEYCLAGGRWSERVPVFRAQDMIRAAGFGVPFSVRYRFQAAALPAGPAWAMVENPEWFTITLNGQPVGGAAEAGFWDWSFELVDITGRLRPGENCLELAGCLRLDQEYVNGYNWYGESFRFPAPVEACAIVGSFAVQPGAAGFALHAEPSTTSAADLTREGYPFYAGQVLLAQDIDLPDGWQQAILDLKGLETTVAEVSLNGRTAGTLAWPPHHLDVTALAAPGRNRLEIKLVNSLHNLLGPWHNPVGEVPAPIHWHAWRNAESWTDDYYFKPFGLSGAAFRLYR